MRKRTTTIGRGGRVLLPSTTSIVTTYFSLTFLSVILVFVGIRLCRSFLDPRFFVNSIGLNLDLSTPMFSLHSVSCLSTSHLPSDS